jgi:hypothetical protein
MSTIVFWMQGMSDACGSTHSSPRIFLFAYLFICNPCLELELYEIHKYKIYVALMIAKADGTYSYRLA